MYRLIREKRKSVTFSIDEGFNVVVKAPWQLSEKIINEMLLKHKERIEKAIEKKKEIMQATDWLTHKKILYLGDYRQICMIYQAAGKDKVDYVGDTFYIYTKDLSDTNIRKQMYSFIQHQAKILLTELTEVYCKRLQCTYAKISIRNQKTRWGSCSSSHNLSYNIRMMGAPLDKIEYIVLHEVMHLKHFNHSKEFWQAILQIMPDYKEKQQYFKQYGQYLTI